MTLDRRTFLGGIAALPFAARGWASAPLRRPRSLVLVWLDGGMSHVDTFDGKPDASPAIRGDLGVLRGKGALDGVFVSEHLPGVAARLSRCALLRSVTHGEGNHDRGSHLLLTGHRPSPVLVHPPLGAVLGHDDDAVLPPYVAIPASVEYGGHGFLPATRGPFVVGGDPGRADFAVRDLGTADAAGSPRAQQLRDRLDELDAAAHAGARSGVEAQRDHFAAMARRLSADAAARRWFDLAAESAELRQRYGRHRLGQSCLLARRLVEGGARTVLVTDTGWDHHVNVRNALTYGFPPKLRALDESLSALLDDLRDRQLDDSVLVCVASEFGRTPRLNPQGGRDHWPRAQSVLLYGAGIRPAVVGRTDARGEEPVERPIAPAELFATLASALGIDPQTVLRSADGRPVRLIADEASPIHEVLRT